MSESLRSYDVARKTFSFLEFVGWSVVVIAVLVGVLLVGSASGYASEEQIVVGFLLGVCGSLIGLFMVGAVQNWRAGVDAAEYAQQALQVAREQLEISRQSLKRQQADSQSFATLQSTAEQQPTTSYERQEPNATHSPNTSEPGEHRGHKIFRVGASYRAVGDVFSSHDEAVAAIDKKLDAPAIEEKPELPASMLLDQDPHSEDEERLAPVEQPSAEGAEPSPRSYSEAETPVKPSEPNLATTTREDLEDQEVNEEIHEPVQEMNAEPEPSPEEVDPVSKIREDDGKFLYGRMEFSSREAAEKYVRQLGVNPNFRS